MTRRPGVSVGLGLLVAALAVSCTSSSSSSSSSSSPSPSVPKGSLQLKRLPPIAQIGSRAVAADDAEAVLDAATKPVKPGVGVILQRRTTAGWTQAGTTTTNSRGHAQFRVPATGAQAYRVALEGRPKVHSRARAGNTWKVDFSDEFDGSTLDSRWAYRQLGLLSPESRRSVSASSKDAVSVRAGALRLQVKRDPQHPARYLNGHIGTAASYQFTYGVAAARIKFQQPRGTHGAFWSQSPALDKFPGNPAKSGAEIDIGEYFGNRYPGGGLASYVYHRDQDNENVKAGSVLPSAVRAVGSSRGFWKKYHVYSVEWSPGGYVFRIDGDVTYRTSKAVSQRSQYLILSLLSSDWELADLDKSLLPATMSVDWVRVWQRPPR